MAHPPDRVIQTVLGPAYLPGSNHWTDEEFEAWKLHERERRAWFDGMTVAMKTLGWEFWSGHWYENGVERGGIRARHPELAPRWIDRRSAEILQSEKTPNFCDPPPEPPANLPIQRTPTYEIGAVQRCPMERPASSLFFMKFDYSAE